MIMNKKARIILRELAARVAHIAHLPVQQETISLWKALNGLKPVRPMAMIDQIPWHEMENEDELTLQTEDPLCRGYETDLRRTLYRWKHIPADMVVEPFIEVPKVIRGLNFGIDIVERTSAVDPNNKVVGHFYIDQLKTEDDIRKIRNPEPVLDPAASAEAQARAQEIFDGILDVRMQGCHPTMKLWDLLVSWRGPEDLLYDLADRPEFMHKLVSRLSEAHLCMLDKLEEKNLLGFAQAAIHCSGAHTDELPAAGFDPDQMRTKDIWTYGMAQIFSSVSPAMHKEFELDYVAGLYARFGLVYYGCCEPLHEKIGLIRQLPHVRKISMSPWADVERGAEQIGRDFVFSRKPSPALLAGESWEPEAVRKDLRDCLQRCARHGCPLEIILKDISTVRYQPHRLWEWNKIVKEEIGRL